MGGFCVFITDIDDRSIADALPGPLLLFFLFLSPGIAPYSIQNLRQYLTAFYNLSMEGLNSRMLREHERPRTIYISTGNVSPRVRKIPEETRTLLFNNGDKAARQFIAERYR